MNPRLAACALGFCILLGRAAGQAPASPLSSGKSLLDPVTGVTYCLEPDRHHVIALDKNNHVLWQRDFSIPKDAKDSAYHGGKIVYFGFGDPANSGRYRAFGRAEDFLEIGLDTTVFGLVRKKDGSFIFLGHVEPLKKCWRAPLHPFR